MLDHLVKLAQLCLLVLVELPHDQLLGAHTVAHLLLELLQGCLHPVIVVLRRLHSSVRQLPPDVAPDLSHLEVRVHLYHLQLLLFLRRQVVPGKSHPVKHRKHNQSDIVLFHLFSNPVYEVGLSSSISQVLQVSRLRKVLLLFLRHQRFLVVDHHSLLILDPIFFILLTV